MKRIILRTAVTLLLFNSIPMQAQHTWETSFEELLTNEDIESGTWQEAYDLLCELATHPVSLNTATREDLEQIPFLTDQQIEDICAYLYQYGDMKSLGELAMIESLDESRRQLLTHFVYLETTEKKSFPLLRQIAHYGKHEIIATGKIPFYERRGDDEGYLGYPYRHSLRYTFSYGDYLKIGLLGSQDAGEPFFANRNSWGYDHYSFYALVRKLGKLKALVAGRYKLKFGMGLVINNDFSFGKMATLSNLGRSSNSIRGYSSRSAANYLQGAAATINVMKGLDFTAFVSHRYIDATLNSDGQSIATILTDGYHRTQTEMQKKHNASMTVAGGNLHYFNNGFHGGLTATYTKLDKPIEPKNSQIYRRYYADGDHFWNMSVDYGYTGHRLTLAGETAIDNGGAIATLNKLSWQASPQFDLMALQRFYSYKYHALLATSFSEGGSVQNESGIYIGATWRPLHNLTLLFYSDYAYFAWAKYQAAEASRSWDNLVEITYRHHKLTFGGRYRYKVRERDNETKTALINNTTQRARIYASWDNGIWATKTQADLCDDRYKEHSSGWMVSQNLTFRYYNLLQLTASLGYFHTDSYASRLYAYERDLLYTFSFPAFYGKGIRYAFFARADLSRHWMLIAKLGTTDYFDRDHISSGYQQINRSSQTDLELQLRCKF